MFASGPNSALLLRIRDVRLLVDRPSKDLKLEQSAVWPALPERTTGQDTPSRERWLKHSPEFLFRATNSAYFCENDLNKWKAYM